MTSREKNAALAIAGTALALFCAAASAQDSTKPLRVVLGFAPGGGHDTIARVLAPRVGTALKASTIVDNRPGANGIIAMQNVVKSAPDGTTVILTGVSTFVLNQLLYPKAPYDTLKDLAPVTVVAATPQILTAHPGLPVKSLHDVVALARRSPGKLSIATPGLGGISHLTLEILKSERNLDIEHIPYKGTGASLIDAVGGFVPLLMGDLAGPLPHVKAGKLKAIAVTGESRSPLLPEVPTATEQGYPELRTTNWYGVMAATATPPAVIAKLHAAFSAAVQAADTRERYAGVGVDPIYSETPGAFGSFMREEFARWGKVVRSRGIKLEQ